MRNYIIEDEDGDYEELISQNPVNHTKYIYIGLAVLAIMIIVIIIVSGTKVRTSYSSLEIEMVEKAEKYVKKNYLELNKEIYIDADKLDIDVPDNCNLLSGVIYSKDEYIPYLLCDDYVSDYLDDNGSIRLRGNKVILLTTGSDYYELGHISSMDVQISGDVNTNEEGVYNVYYIPKEGNYAVVRKVIVVDNDIARNLQPIINVNSDNYELDFGNQYIDDVMAVDKIDGNITNKMIKIDTVNENEIGEYQNIYSVTNTVGYTTMAMRTITVLNRGETNIFVELSDDNMSNTSIDIKVKIIGDNYSYAILPDNKEKSTAEFFYEVEENGKYEFIAVNNDGTRVSKIVNVTNIDKTKPTGTCSAISYYSKTVFTVSIDSFNYIVGYNYIANGKESGYIPNSSYTIDVGNTSNLSVKVKDYIGNENTITCKVTEKRSNFDPTGYKVIIRDKPRLQEPISDALAKNGFTVNDMNMCIYNKVQEAGPYTRYGVTAAAYGLIECTMKMTGGRVLSYNHEGGKVDSNYCATNSDICGKLGINRIWGSRGGACGSKTGDDKVCYQGLNCATFVRWAMCNGGMNLCTGGSASAVGSSGMINKIYFPGADGVDIQGKNVAYYMGRDLSGLSADTLFRMLKPGDVMGSDEGGGHAFVVMGIDNEAIYTAEDGYFTKKRPYSSLVSGDHWYRLLFLDNYYALQSNRNNLYN